MRKPILFLDKVLEVESHGLSLSKSAYLLGVSIGALCKFINKHKIEWRGKGNRFGDGNK